MTTLLTRADRALLQSMNLGGELKQKVAGATIVRAETVPPDVVTLNSRVAVVEAARAQPTVVTLVADSPGASARKDKVSVHTALGTALLGASAGDTVEIGQRRLRVREVLYQPERARYGALPLAP